MIRTEDIIADLHTHTLSSHHAYSTVDENLACAQKACNRFCLGTDAYFCREIGHFDKCIAILNEFGIDKGRVVNCCEEEVRGYVKEGL